MKKHERSHRFSYENGITDCGIQINVLSTLSVKITLVLFSNKSTCCHGYLSGAAAGTCMASSSKRKWDDRQIGPLQHAEEFFRRERQSSECLL